MQRNATHALKENLRDSDLPAMIAPDVLGIILADKQDFTAAADELRTYLKFAPDAQDADKVKTQLDQLDKLAKK